MPLNPHVVKAFRAMKALGISEDTVKPALKSLLKLYNKNWELIEEENYRVLLDAIFENEESEAAKKKKSASNEVLDKREREQEDAQEPDEMEQPLKRSRLRYPQGQSLQSFKNSSSQSGGTSLIQPKDEPVELLEVPPLELLSNMEDEPELCSGDGETEAQRVNSEPLVLNKRKQPVPPNSLMTQDLSNPVSIDKCQTPVPQRAECGAVLQTRNVRNEAKETFSGEMSSGKVTSSHAVHFEELGTEEGLPSATPQMNDSQALIQEAPIAAAHPEIKSIRGSSEKNSRTREFESHALVVSELVGGKDSSGGFPAISSHTGTDGGLGNVPAESSSQLQIASSSSGHIKLSLSYHAPPGGSDFHMPSMDELIKTVEDKCHRSFKILDLNFSVMKVMQDMCECFLILGSEKLPMDTQISSNVDQCGSMNPSVATRMPFDTAKDFLNAPPLPLNHEDCISTLCDNVSEINSDLMEIEQNVDDDTNSRSLVPVEQHQLASDDIRSLHSAIDICKGQESVVISLVNEVNTERPPSFYYIPQNVVFLNAYVNFSLARIEDMNSCPVCFGNCLSLPTPCACAHESGGEFAYTVDGLVKEEFIEECISMNRDPEKHCQYFCKECPLERSKKKDVIGPCRGHLVGKFIKECWWKCGCSKQCGNRVVQHGITRNLQVFMTRGKGWGLRTLEDLPKGAFVCEYVGEILTNAELFDRVSKSHKGEEHLYPVLLDADWVSEGILKDEEALCLDATYYGNVARFINHRCFDSTLVEIPVEIETPDHHYYHLAFFTTREVKAMEELTWDYGIDFDKRIHPIKAFRCLCGSRHCRNMRPPRIDDEDD